MLTLKIIVLIALLIILYINGKKFHKHIEKKYNIHLLNVVAVIMFGYFIVLIGTWLKQPYGKYPEKILSLLIELKIIEAISFINTASLVLYVIGLCIVLSMGYVMIKSFGFWVGLSAFLTIATISYFALLLVLFLFILSIFLGGMTRNNQNAETSSAFPPGYDSKGYPLLQYQGDRSMVGGVVGGRGGQ